MTLDTIFISLKSFILILNNMKKLISNNPKKVNIFWTNKCDKDAWFYVEDDWIYFVHWVWIMCYTYKIPWNKIIK